MYIMLSKTFSRYFWTTTAKRPHQASFWRATLLLCLGLLSLNSWSQSAAQSASGGKAEALLAKHKSLASALASNAYGRPLFLDSTESDNVVSGNAYAVLDAPFATVTTTFRSGNNWCDMMMLHINTKYCRALPGSGPTLLKVNIGKKTPQTLQESFSLVFAMREATASNNLLLIQLNAENGPMGTSNYRIELQATPLEDGKTFMHLRYSYQYGTAGQLAMQAYLATAGRGKVGFSTTGPVAANAKAKYVGGARGAVERNTMRYYLAIDAYLDALSLPPAQQSSARLEKWFDATEQYPLQLREADKSSYLTMKKSEIQRQQSSTPAL